MRRCNIPFGLAIPAILVGCAATGPTVPDDMVQFLVNTEPQAATVYVDNKAVGVTPAKLNFGPLTAQNRTEKKMQTKPITFVWTSGARKTTNLWATWHANQRAYHVSVTVTRPPVDGHLIDVEHASRTARTQQLAAAEEKRKRDAEAADTTLSILGLVLSGAAAYSDGKNDSYQNVNSINSIDSGGTARPAQSGGSTAPNCIGYSGPGGPCSTGPGGGLYTGPGGGAYTGPGGGAYTGPGGGLYTGPGGGLYTGPGGGAYTGPGGGAYTGPGGGAYTGPGGGSYSGPGGPCSSGPNDRKFDQWNRPSPYCK